MIRLEKRFSYLRDLIFTMKTQGEDGSSNFGKKYKHGNLNSEFIKHIEILTAFLSKKCMV